MLMLNDIDAIMRVDLPEGIKAQLSLELLTPFDGDEQALRDFWRNSATALYVVTQQDGPDFISQLDEISAYYIELALDCPEYVLVLNDDRHRYYLSVTIISDDGSGCYVLIKDSHPSDASLRLAELIG